MIEPEDLAEARGCFTWNDCWSECVESARYTIEDQRDEAEIAWAEAWLAKQVARRSAEGAPITEGDPE